MLEQTAQDQQKSSSGSSNKNLIIIVVVVVLILLGAGSYYMYQQSAERAAEKKIEEVTGGKVNIEGDKVTIETDQGKVTTSKSEVPESFPSDVTVYKGSEVTGSTEAEGGVTLMLATSDSVKQVSDFYNADLKKNGWKITASSNLEGSSLVTAEKGSKSLLITVAPDASSGKTAIAIVASTAN